MKKIVVPCDFSRPAVEAFRFAIDLAKRSGGNITVFTVIDVPVVVHGASVDVPSYDFSPSLYKLLEEAATRNYDKMVKRFAGGFKRLSFAIAQGPTSAMITDFVSKNKIDLIVMGTHGATGLKEWFVGSTTEKVVRFSKVPVFAIHKAIPLSSIKNIVFPTSLEPGQGDFIRRLKAVQKFFHAKLHILFLNTPFSFVRDKDLKDYAKQHRFTNCTLNIRNDRYEPDGIHFFVKEIKAAMLAMPTHGRKGLSHVLSGSVTEDVVNHVKCPVWTFALRKKK